jgi:hypothetical protein
MASVLLLKAINGLEDIGRRKFMEGTLSHLLQTNITVHRYVCFASKKLAHPQVACDKVIKINNGSFICLNDKCHSKYVVMSREKLYALAIDLAGIAQLLFGVTSPCFDHQPTNEKELRFNKLALAFCTKIACRLALVESKTL